MKSLKQLFNKIKLFIFHILEVVIDFMNTNAQVEIEKIKAGKEILMATGSTVKNVIKAPLKKENMRVTGVVVIGLGGSLIILGGSLIIASYLN